MRFAACPPSCRCFLPPGDVEKTARARRCGLTMMLSTRCSPTKSPSSVKCQKHPPADLRFSRQHLVICELSTFVCLSASAADAYKTNSTNCVPSAYSSLISREVTGLAPMPILLALIFAFVSSVRVNPEFPFPPSVSLYPLLKLSKKAATSL